ncbi:hypothetical protein THAOC_23218 [Thalassiosira oceanica]|uniref:Uncharacterized protein n=1 Tax=Thalassiosira oceanica TaxID=159749 RepID=K0RSN3_THAOC|nr:hypothetical protein THAOC_23218 [Thalassiosira oceanica]|eukprot:EJK56818.1 hypothetical protein THAOC_23218 [Thalassiosira oceanica]
MANLALYDRHVRGGRGPGRGSGPWSWKWTSRVNLAFGFGNVILSLWKQGPGRGKGLVGQWIRTGPQRINLSFGFGNVIRSSTYSDHHDAKMLRPAVHIIHHQAGGREKCSRFNISSHARQPCDDNNNNNNNNNNNKQERINAGPEARSRPAENKSTTGMPMTMPDAVAPVLSGDVLGMPQLRHPAFALVSAAAAAALARDSSSLALGVRAPPRCPLGGQFWET